MTLIDVLSWFAFVIGCIYMLLSSIFCFGVVLEWACDKIYRKWDCSQEFIRFAAQRRAKRDQQD